MPSTERRRWRSAEHDIPEQPAGIASDKGENADREDIETVLDAIAAPLVGHVPSVLRNGVLRRR